MKEVAAAIQGMKSGKTACEDKIRPKMLKIFNGDGERWLTRVFQVAWKVEKTPKDWQTGVIIPIYKSGNRKLSQNITTPRNSGIKVGR